MLYHTLLPLCGFCITFGDVTLEQQRLNYLDERRRERKKAIHTLTESHTSGYSLQWHARRFIYLCFKPATPSGRHTYLESLQLLLSNSTMFGFVEKEREPIPASTATSERTHAGLANAALGTYLIPITPPRPLSLKRVLRMDTQARESAPSHEQAEQWCSWLATLSQWQRRAEER
jgi:hypothetical protein